MRTYNIITIETAPLAEEEIKSFIPTFEAPANYKDPKKIAEYVAAKKEKFMADAAFEPTTGRIVGVGILPVENGVGKDPIVITSTSPAAEKLMVQTIRDLCPEPLGDSPALVGWYLRKFILPFATKRMWKLGIKDVTTHDMTAEDAYKGILTTDLAGRARHGHYTDDLADDYACGEPHAHPKLEDALAFLLDRPRVVEPTVAALLQEGAEKDAAACIIRDLELLRLLGQRMGVIA